MVAMRVLVLEHVGRGIRDSNVVDMLRWFRGCVSAARVYRGCRAEAVDHLNQLERRLLA